MQFNVQKKQHGSIQNKTQTDKAILQQIRIPGKYG